MKLIFPEAILDQHLVALGKTGAGKSSALRHVVEWLLKHNKRVCVVDPKGDWYGLKLSADGKAAGFPVVLFGDFKDKIKGDVPLIPRSKLDDDQVDVAPAARHVAELVVSGNRPCVIGMRGWTQGNMTRFWIEFASTLFNSESGELYLVIDEAHNFAPKGKVMSVDSNKSLHWTNRLMNEGRGIGMINLIASQRPQKVHNDTLTACETLVAMRVVHKADRNAVEEWIEGCGDPAKGKEVLNSLAGMKRGEAFVWSSEIAFGPERLAFPMFETFDSFAPARLQKKISQKGWASVDLTEVREKLARVIEQAKAEDPVELNKTIAALRKEIVQLQKNTQPREQDTRRIAELTELLEAEQARVKPAAEPKVIEKRILAVQSINRLEQLLEKAVLVAPVVEEIRTAIREGKELNAQQMITAPTKAPVLSPRARQTAGYNPSSTIRALSAQLDNAPARVNGDFTLTKKQQEILNALAWLESIGISRPANIQLGAVAMVDTSGGYFSNMAGPLNSAGLIVRGQGATELTTAGRALAVLPDSVASLDEYHDMLRARVRKLKSANGKSVAILDVLIANGVEMSTQDIGAAIGVDPSGGYFSNSIGPLSTLGLIQRSQGMVRPTQVMFPPGLA